ncbi:MAG: diguanylate cyclase [Candidatus Coatesbacteria bacterium]|nr:diguanylate cyclase [Candidatus Coatesbacteria bacterium]
MAEIGDLTGSITELLKLSRSSDDFLPVFRRVLEHLTRTTVCRHPRIVWYPERCPLFDRRYSGSGDSGLVGLTLDDFPEEVDADALVFSLPLHSRGRLYGRLEVFGLELDQLLDSDVAAAQSYAEILTTVITDRLSRIDAVTRLYIRDVLEERLPRLIQESRGARTGLGVVMVDLDHFKRVNDTYGHAVGDRALRTAAAVLRRTVEGGGFAARYGGEELVAVIDGAHAADTARIAETARRNLARRAIPVPEKGLSFQITASFGAALYPDHGRTATELLAAADEAVYAAKEAGRDRVMTAGSPPRPVTRREAEKVATEPVSIPPPKKKGTSKKTRKEPSTLPIIRVTDQPRRPERRRGKAKPTPPPPPPPRARGSLAADLRERLAKLDSVRAYDLSTSARLGLRQLKPYFVDEHRGELFVIEYHQHRVHRLPLHRILREQKRPRALRGRVSLTTLGGGSGPAALVNPSAVAVDDDGYLWITDTFNHQVKQYDRDGSYRDRSFGGPGDAPGSLMQPQDLSFYGELLLVADTGNHRLQGYGPSGRWDFEIGVRPAEGGGLSQPTKLAVSPDGRLFVLDLVANRVVIYDHRGDYQGELADYGTGPGQFRSPTDLAVTREGVLVVSEGGDNNRLQFFDASADIAAPESSPGEGNLYGGGGAAGPALEHLGTLELGGVLWSGDRLLPLARTRHGEPDVRRLRPWSVAGGTINELFLVDQNSNHLLGLKLAD